MSIRSTVGSITHNLGNDINSAISTGRTLMENIVGSTSTQLSNIWGGGFTGMNHDEIGNLRDHLWFYASEVEELINSFNEEGDISISLKGDAQIAAIEFIKAVKQMLQAYVSTLKQEISEIDEAYQNFLTANSSVASDVQSAADEIRQNAQQIRLD